MDRRSWLRGAALVPPAQGALGALPAAPAGAQSAASDAAWDGLVAAAVAEGALALLTVVGRGYGGLVERFVQDFPGIAVAHRAESSASAWLASVRGARAAGAAAFDVALGIQADRALTDGTPEGLWAHLRPQLFRPDVVDDAAWRDGLQARFVDAAGDTCLAWSYPVFHAFAVNTDLVPAEAIGSVEDLLQPRWRGRILSLDPRSGTGLAAAAGIARRWGQDTVARLFAGQRPVIVAGGPGDVAGPLARGQYPIALGVRPKALDPLRAQGLGLQVRYLDLPDADFVPASPLLLLDRAPHPAAARLFANWVLTQEAQTHLTGGLLTNSARTDVAPASPDETGAAGAAYYEPDRETNFAHTAATRSFLRGLLGPA
jgi:iron(III) transport system substrate-binding protein